jgi:alkylation response protein AidB-like acyl-CoA dehydrogenase
MSLRLAASTDNPDGDATVPASKSLPLLIEATRLGKVLAAGASARDLERRLPHEEVAALKASGLLAARIPAKHGGPGLDWLDTSRIVLALSRGDPNIAQSIQPHLTILEQVAADGSDLLQHRIFTSVLAGKLIANAAAERGGAFYGDIATRLTADPKGGFRLDGRKYYSTGSLFADTLYVTALNEAGKVVAVLFPRDREGVTILDDWNGLGQRTSASGTVELTGVRVSEDEIIRPPSPAERRWHVQAAAQLIHVAIDSGIALAALDDAIHLARSRGRTLRESGVERAVDDPYVLQTIGELSAAASGAVAILERSAGFVDRAARAFFTATATEADFVAGSIAVAEAKIVSTEAALRNGEKLFLVANASGTDRALNLDRHWRNARTHTTHDPIAYKYKFIGDFLLNGRAPPSSVKI